MKKKLVSQADFTGSQTAFNFKMKEVLPPYVSIFNSLPVKYKILVNSLQIVKGIEVANSVRRLKTCILQYKLD